MECTPLPIRPIWKQNGELPSPASPGGRRDREPAPWVREETPILPSGGAAKLDPSEFPPGAFLCVLFCTLVLRVHSVYCLL